MLGKALIPKPVRSKGAAENWGNFRYLLLVLSEGMLQLYSRQLFVLALLPLPALTLGCVRALALGSAGRGACCCSCGKPNLQQRSWNLPGLPQSSMVCQCCWLVCVTTLLAEGCCQTAVASFWTGGDYPHISSGEGIKSTADRSICQVRMG